MENRRQLIHDLQNHSASDEKERADVQNIIRLLEEEPDCFHRDCFPRHITGSALLVNSKRNKVLMNQHKSLKKWLCFGGHADGEEDIANVAKRETEEESGTSGFTKIGPGIIDVDIHTIPANPQKQEPVHEHCDIRYIFALIKDQDHVTSEESVSLKWCDYEEAIDLTIHESPTMARLIRKAQTMTGMTCS